MIFSERERGVVAHVHLAISLHSCDWMMNSPTLRTGEVRQSLGTPLPRADNRQMDREVLHQMYCQKVRVSTEIQLSKGPLLVWCDSGLIRA
jgi:hypothetical protein